MTASGEVTFEVCGHRVTIFRDQQSSLALSPRQDRGIVGAERNVLEIADAHGVERWLAAEIVTENCLPQWAAQMLVE
jgi:hypothetical protein